jgi:ABC-type uncharacterized transport system permease subunit
MINRRLWPAYVASFCMGVRISLRDRNYLLSKLVIFTVLLLIFYHIFAIMPLERLNAPQITVRHLLWYFVVTEIVTIGTMGSRREFGNAIATGQITTLMQRPGSMMGMMMARLLGGWVIQMLLLFGFAAVALTLFGLPMPMPLEQLPVLLMMLMLGGLITLLLGYLSGMFEIFGPYSLPIDWILHKFVMALGGLFFPVSLFPPLIQQSAMLTPFPAILFIPASLMLGISKASMLEGVLIQLFWLAVLVALAIAMEGRLVRRVMRIGD